MKTNLLQSQLHRNARVITELCRHMHDARAHAKGAQLAGSRKQHRAYCGKLKGTINKLADIQRELKRDLLAHKLARVHVYKKHGKNDPRYTAWIEAQQAAECSGENYVPMEFFPPIESSLSCGC